MFLCIFLFSFFPTYFYFYLYFISKLFKPVVSSSEKQQSFLFMYFGHSNKHQVSSMNTYKKRPWTLRYGVKHMSFICRLYVNKFVTLVFFPVLLLFGREPCFHNFNSTFAACIYCHRKVLLVRTSKVGSNKGLHRIAMHNWKNCINGQKMH